MKDITIKPTANTYGFPTELVHQLGIILITPKSESVSLPWDAYMTYESMPVNRIVLTGGAGSNNFGYAVTKLTAEEFNSCCEAQIQIFGDIAGHTLHQLYKELLAAGWEIVIDDDSSLEVLATSIEISDKGKVAKRIAETLNKESDTDHYVVEAVSGISGNCFLGEGATEELAWLDAYGPKPWGPAGERSAKGAWVRKVTTTELEGLRNQN